MQLFWSAFPPATSIEERDMKWWARLNYTMRGRDCRLTCRNHFWYNKRKLVLPWNWLFSLCNSGCRDMNTEGAGCSTCLTPRPIMTSCKSPTLFPITTFRLERIGSFCWLPAHDSPQRSKGLMEMIGHSSCQWLEEHNYNVRPFNWSIGTCEILSQPKFVGLSCKHELPVITPIIWNTAKC
jgi:hypothetical protein